MHIENVLERTTMRNLVLMDPNDIGRMIIQAGYRFAGSGKFSGYLTVRQVKKTGYPVLEYDGEYGKGVAVLEPGETPWLGVVKYWVR